MSTSAPVNILLVDDQPAKLLSYEVVLEELGERLLKASSGREALELLLRHEVAVVLIDVSMPELDGFELAALIQDHPRFRGTPIIFVSAIHLSEMDRLRGYAAGAVDYVPVPIVPELLRAKVRVFADLYRKTRQLERLNAELEQRVAERTAELEATNADLERRVEARTREREAALAQVIEMQKMESIGQLTGGIAHDFNNLLTVVLSSVRLASDHLRDEARAARLLETAAQAAECGATLVKRMLAFARRQDLCPETVKIGDIVENMAEIMRHSLNPTVRIEVRVPDTLPPVRVDRNQLELALLNLGLNARDAMPDGGVLRIDANSSDAVPVPDGLAPGRYVLLRVSDSGVGMDAATLKRASEPFFTTKSVGKGSGLGLPMVHGLMLQSGGLMSIASEPGQGTSVGLWLPAAEAAPAPDPARVAPEAAVSALRIVLVDDDPLVLMTTAEMLRDLGHAVTECESGAQALDVIDKSAEVDLVITDHAMPEMTGSVLAAKLRVLRPDLPILLASGFAETALQVREGVHRLSKPFSMADLQRGIARATGTGQAVSAA